MSLKHICRNRVINNILNCTKNSSRKILICDEHGLAVISSLFKLKEMIENGVTSVEPLMKNRQPLKMEAIYFVAPTEINIKRIIQDFSIQILYTAAHIYTTSHLSLNLIEDIKNSNIKRYLKTFSESYIDYFIQEKNVFILNKNLDVYPILYGGKDLTKYIDKWSEQLSSLCITLNCKPLIFCQKNSESGCKLVGKIVERLKYVDINTNSDTVSKNTTLLILDRFFDGVTPLMHELTLQAMAADVLNLTENVYVYKNLNGIETTSFLDESNELWSQHSHKHIADVIQIIPSAIKEMASQNKMKLPNNNGSLQDLKVMLSKLPQYKAELNRYQMILNLAESCYNKFESKKLDKLCAIEQDIATGTDKNGEIVTDPIAHMLPILQGNYSIGEKLRIILLYALTLDNGIPQDNLDRIIEHGKLKNEKSIFSKFNKMDLKVLESDELSKSLKRSQQYIEGGYSLSRFIPILKKIMQQIINGEISNKEFVQVSINESSSDSNNKTTNTKSQGAFKFGKWKNDSINNSEKLNNQRFIVFILGGVTFSEIRCSYEISKENNWDTIIGSTQILTPDLFLKSISKL